MRKLHNSPIPQLQNRRRSRGYVLITLMLFFALLAMALLALPLKVKTQIQRDNEEEMRHRGTEYMRAIKKYYKKFGRYPNRIEDLENTNNLRFLRRRYKDPLNNQDFRILHYTDIAMAGGQITGAGFSPAGAQPGLGPQALGGQLGNQPGGLGGLGGLAGGIAGALGRQPGGMTPAPVAPDQGGNSGESGGSESQSGGTSTGSESTGAGSTGSTPSGNQPQGQLGGGGLTGQTFGGGPILGVASKSKKKSIRVFNKKDHYNDWLFYYDPASDRGGLLVGPYQPALNITGGPGMGVPVQQMQPGAGATSGSPFGAQPPQGLPQPQPQSPSPNAPPSQDSPEQ